MPRVLLTSLDASGRLLDTELPDAAVTSDELAAALTPFGRDRGTGTSLPTTDLRRGDVYHHATWGGLLANVNGTATGWRQVVPGELTQAQRAALDTAPLYQGFQIRETNTGRVMEWNGSLWHILSGPKVHLLARMDPNQGSLPIATGWQEVPFFGEVVDTDGCLNPSAGNVPASSRFYAPLQGYYTVRGAAAFGIVAAQDVVKAVTIGTNGRDAVGGTALFTGGPSPVVGATALKERANGVTYLVTQTQSRRVYLNAGQYVSLCVYSNVATSLAAWNTDAGQQTFLEVIYDGI